MPRNPEAILIEALQLPKQERAELISVLIRSLDEHIDEGVDEAWEQEIAKRLKEIDDGDVEMIPGVVVRAKARAIFDGEQSDDRLAS